MPVLHGCELSGSSKQTSPYSSAARESPRIILHMDYKKIISVAHLSGKDPEISSFCKFVAYKFKLKLVVLPNVVFWHTVACNDLENKKNEVENV